MCHRNVDFLPTILIVFSTVNDVESTLLYINTQLTQLVFHFCGQARDHDQPLFGYASIFSIKLSATSPNLENGVHPTQQDYS